MPTHRDLLDAVENYQNQYRASDLGRFETSNLYDMFPCDEDCRDSDLCWPAVWPHANRAGIYAFLDEFEHLLYVGKASMRNSIGARIASYCGYSEGIGSPCKLYHQWRTTPKYVVIVAVPEDSRFEAPALEEYLITQLQPPENSQGIDAR